MGNFDLKNSRMLIILAIICLAFIGLVWNAFSYLPANNDMQKSVSLNTSDEIDKEDDTNLDQEDFDQDEQTDETSYDNEVDDEVELEFQRKIERQRKEEQEMLKESQQQVTETFDNNERPNAEFLQPNNFDNLYSQADSEVSANNLTEAVNLYKKACESASNNEDKAKCYEKIARIYAVTKRYGTALAYAQKAYLAQATHSRELLLAKLYYKTGDKEKANRKIESLLLKDFQLED